MTWFDYALLAIMGSSLLLGMFSGFVRAMCSLLGWFCAFGVARSYSDVLSPKLSPWLDNDTLRLYIAFLVLFVLTLLVMGILGQILSGAFGKMGMTGYDRWLGALFGVLRGVVVIWLLVLLAGLTTLPQKPFWRHALWSDLVERLVVQTLPWLPVAISQHVTFGKL